MKKLMGRYVDDVRRLQKTTECCGRAEKYGKRHI